MPKRFGIALPAWPAADREAWLRAITPGEFFDDSAIASHWSPSTKASALSSYSRWLAFLAEHFAGSLTQTISERTCPAHIGAYVEALSIRVSAMSVASELGFLMRSVCAMAPEVQWTWLRQRHYHWQKLARPRDKRAKIIHPSRLYDLGLLLMDGAEQVRQVSAKGQAYRDGLLIALLAARPLRGRSLSAMRIGSLSRAGDTYVIAISHEDTKADKDIEFPLPPSLTVYIERYLEHYRAMHASASTHQGMWPSVKGGPLQGGSIYNIICKRTKKAFGFSINPHLFRDIAATSIARYTPGNIHLARDILTHANLSTTARYYIQAQTLDAARTHAELINGLRGGSKLA